MHRSRVVHAGNHRRAGVRLMPRPLPGRPSSSRIVRRLLAGLAVGFAVLLMTGSPASAHAQLESSDPRPGEILTQAPSRVTLIFGERVEFTSTAIQVFADHLRPVRNGPVVAVARDGTPRPRHPPSGCPPGARRARG